MSKITDYSFFISQYVWNKKHKRCKCYRQLSVVAVKQQFCTGTVKGGGH